MNQIHLRIPFICCRRLPPFNDWLTVEVCPTFSDMTKKVWSIDIRVRCPFRDIIGTARINLSHIIFEAACKPLGPLLEQRTLHCSWFLSISSNTIQYLSVTSIESLCKQPNLSFQIRRQNSFFFYFFLGLHCTKLIESVRESMR